MTFTTQQHHTWQTLFTRQVPNISAFACREFLDGFTRLDLPLDHIPSLLWLNAKIHPASGWTVVRTPIRYLTGPQWAKHLSQKQLPITGYIRSQAELDFTPEPDIFHDIFGHLPMFMNQPLLQILNLFSSLYAQSSLKTLPPVSQLWWNTFEFGLVKEAGQIKAFGAGLISSFGEIAHATSPTRPTLPFSLTTATKNHSAVASFHSKYFIINSLNHLHDQLLKFRVK